MSKGGTPFMNDGLKLLFALLLALGLGIVATLSQNAALMTFAGWLEPIGTIWIGFLKMTMLPLVISLLIISVGTTRNMDGPPILKRTLLVFSGLYAFFLAIAIIIVPFLFRLLPDSSALPANLLDNAAISAEKPLSFLDQIIGWVPVNPFKSATDGAILPLVVFSLLFGLAVNHIADDQKKVITLFFQAVSEVMLKIVE
jgi:proton glutamate symport protein